MLMQGTSARVPAFDLAAATPAEIAAASWIAGYSNHLTRRSYATHIREWFQFCADYDVDPMAAQRVHVELWVRSIEGRGLKPRSCALKVSAIRSFYSYCLDEDWIETSPAARIRAPKIERRSPRGALTRTQLADLIDAAGELGPNQRALVMLLGFNGLRIGETCAANVEDLTFVGFSPVLRLPRRKGGKEGVAALSRPVESALAEAIGGRTSGPLLLNQVGNRITRSNAQRILTRAAKGLRGPAPKLSPHVLRHTWCTLAVQAGASLTRVQTDGGWSDIRMAEYYLHSSQDPLNSSTHLVAAHVLSAA